MSIPLPAGWEAKWDQGQKRYFFLNHRTKTTTWVDPRSQMQNTGQPARPQGAAQTPARAQSRSRENIAMTTLSSSGGTASTFNQQQETSFSDSLEQLKKMFPTAPEFKIKNILNRYGYSVAETARVLQRTPHNYKKVDVSAEQNESPVVSKLHAEFPTAEVGVIRDVLFGHNNDDEKARTELKLLGYQPATSESSSSVSSSSASGSDSPRPSSPQTGPSDAEKEALKAKLVAEFPDYSAAMADIALNSCQYNIENARRLLQNMQKKRETRESTSATKPRARTQSPAAATPSTSVRARTQSPPSRPETSGARAATDFSVKFHEYDSSFTMSTALSGPKKSPTKTVTSPSKSMTSSSKSQAGKRQQRTATESVTGRLAKSPKKTVKTEQKSRFKNIPTGPYVSANRTQAQGPNPELAKGADVNLLIDNYVTYNGPDREIRHGPNRDLVQGPAGAQGPDSDLRHGPDSDLYMEPNPEAWKGSSVYNGQRTYQVEV